MKTIIGISITLLLIITPTLQATCTAGCVACQKAHCLICNGHRFDSTGQQCDTAPAPADDHCDLYEHHVECSWCSQGYVGDILAKGKCSHTHTIQNCVLAVGIAGQEATFACGACNGGFPSKDGHSCENWATDSESVEGPEKNCAWGGRSNEGVNCVRCADGYMNIGGGCVPALFPGCWEANVLQRDCLACDAWKNWHMLSDNGKCTEDKGVSGTGEGVSHITEYLKKFKEYYAEIAKGF